MATTTERREKRTKQIADAAQFAEIGLDTEGVVAVLTVDTTTGEVVEEKKVPSPAKKKPAEKLPYNAVIVEGVTCPECGAPVASARMNGKQFEVCTKQFSEEPECWYARELPKDGDKAKATAVDADGDTHADEGGSGTDETGERFDDGGADLGGAQMKTAAKTEGDGADGDKPSVKTSKKGGKGKK